MRPLALVVLMGFFGSLFGCSKGDGDKPQRYVSESAFRENLAKQTTMSPQTVAQLRKHAVTEDITMSSNQPHICDRCRAATGRCCVCHV